MVWTFSLSELPNVHVQDQDGKASTLTFIKDKPAFFDSSEGKYISYIFFSFLVFFLPTEHNILKIPKKGNSRVGFRTSDMKVVFLTDHAASGRYGIDMAIVDKVNAIFAKAGDSSS